ncbi:cupin-like domain-containing protein [Hirsutella rhossiliensis]|uniref:tRNA wybutosine-synthesizing protein 4 n=1 Tax=Hirsutella rhossiliensis TaxID=111463 RepID=A0A9P8SM92_9HYPO|nr:cupin-like domain-containing protein [Hirsutella rhossiliensis]KAH0968328.1 cupin-like domain-containing protein [Hirsutella rhossiliensis]
MLPTTALNRAARAQTLDDIVMGTNNSSIVSKRSVERLYFPNEPHFFRYFVPKFQRRSPLINRGYWLRLRAIDVVLRHFITRSLTKKRVIINLGCGSDVLPWQCNTRYASACDGLLFIDIDFPDLILKKRAVVLQTPQLRELLGDDFQVNDLDQDRVLLKSERYCQVGCDLRNLDELHQTLETILPLSGCEMLFVAEVSITYMETCYADDLVQWASSLGQAEFCLLEHLLPQGADQPFAATMLSHLNKLNAPPRGWRQVEVWDLWEVWSSDHFLTKAQRAFLDEVEPFDEWEEFMLFARHYALVHASTSPANQDGKSLPNPTSENRRDAAEVSLEVECHQTNAPRRRFGEAMTVSSSMGRQSAIHMMGLGSNGRADSSDVYSLGRHDDLPKLPLIGPPPLESQWTIEFKSIVPTLSRQIGDPLSRFGARCVELGSCTVVCGGMGQDPSVQGRDLVVVSIRDDGSYTTAPLRCQDAACMPFMVGSSVIACEDRLVIIGGGATCFSMGTFWETGVYSITAHDGLWQIVNCASRGSRPAGQPAAKTIVTSVPRIRLGAEKGFDEILGDGKPVIIEGLGLGDCLRKWTSDYLLQQVGGNTEVIVHECHRDTEKMDFNSKNFRYVRDSFEAVMAKMQAGGRLYLRSLSHRKPSEQPANLEEDFPRLAEDFCLPPELNYVSRNLFSSVLRVSGRVNMWLHYDVMANVYTQIVGRKRMVLFPPSDVGHLSFAPGASSSSLDVLASLEAPNLAATRPHEAELGPGDLLFLPPLWLHTSEPTSDLSVAVNVFFRDLESGYATGRDVYGNRDLAAYEKGRQDAMRIAKGFQQLPLETRRFYLTRIADELRVAAEEG